MGKVNICDIPENKTMNDYSDNTIFVHKEHFHRYILEPFEIIPYGDPRYEQALTKEQLKRS